MISIQQAKQHIIDQIQMRAPVTLPITECIGRVIANDIYCPLDLPPFRQSSMDGYAICLDGENNIYKLTGETRAGQAPAAAIERGCTQRVFTGAPLPQGCDTIIKQEDTTVEGDQITMDATALKKGNYVRKIGSDIAEGQLALKAGTILNPGAVAFMASMGFAEIPVRHEPEIALIVSGDELQQGGRKLGPGQIYESNSVTILAALKILKLSRVSVYRLGDDKEQMRTHLQQALSKADVLIFTGGVSVGKYDFTAHVLEEEGVEKIFHGIAQKPGKPMYFGRSDNSWIFALPGNPASALVCFYEYVYPALSYLKGRGFEELKAETMPLGHDLQKSFGRAAFERAVVRDGAVHSLSGQESYMLKSLALANALLVLPEGPHDLKKGELVQVHHLPSF